MNDDLTERERLKDFENALERKIRKQGILEYIKKMEKDSLGDQKVGKNVMEFFGNKPQISESTISTTRNRNLTSNTLEYMVEDLMRDDEALEYNGVLVRNNNSRKKYF